MYLEMMAVRCEAKTEVQAEFTTGSTGLGAEMDG
jgi:hypothetical protein